MPTEFTEHCIYTFLSTFLVFLLSPSLDFNNYFLFLVISQRTAVLGFGRAPKDKISIEVVIIIIVSIGVPALLIFLGSFYVMYKKKPWRNIGRGIKRSVCVCFIIFIYWVFFYLLFRLRRIEGYERIN